MRKPGGYALIVSPVATKVNFDGLRFQAVGIGITESDTFTCCHCNRVIHVPVKAQGDDYFCRNCMAPICPKCADFGCTPFEKKLEMWEARDRSLRSYGL